MAKRRASSRRRTRALARTSPLHVHVWSTLTLCGFITTFLASIMLGARGLMPFLYAGLTLLAVLTLEAFLRGRLWLFEDGYRERFSDIDGMALRILLFSGALLLIMESFVLVMMWV